MRKTLGEVIEELAWGNTGIRKQNRYPIVLSIVEGGRKWIFF